MILGPVARLGECLHIARRSDHAIVIWPEEQPFTGDDFPFALLVVNCRLPKYDIFKLQPVKLVLLYR
jgi:hypothetical protein